MIAKFIKNIKIICLIISSNYKISNLILWGASITLLGIVLFGLIGDNNKHHPLTRIQHILYQSTYRVLWSIGLAYIIFACLNSKGGDTSFLCLRKNVCI